MPNDNPVLELALFTVKPEYLSRMPRLRDGLRETLKDFPGLIEYRAYCPLSERTYADLATWQSHEHAAAVARAFNEGDARFAEYSAAIESLVFMGHFLPEDRS